MPPTTYDRRQEVEVVPLAVMGSEVQGLTVKGLRDMLAELPPDALVVLASDPEGNAFAPATATFSQGEFFYDETATGQFLEVSTDELTDTDRARAVGAVALWPA